MLSTLIAAFVAVCMNFTFRVKVPLTGMENVAEDLTPPGSVFEVLKNLCLSFVNNPINAIANANYIAILFWAVVIGLALKAATPGTKRVFSDLAEALSVEALSDKVRREEALPGEVLPGEVLSGEALPGEALSAEEFSVLLCPAGSWIPGSKTDLLRDSTRELPARNRRTAKAAESTGMKNEGPWTPFFSGDEGTALPDLRTALPDMPLPALFWPVLILPIVFWPALFMAVLFWLVSSL